jgi:hypothetical protein
VECTQKWAVTGQAISHCRIDAKLRKTAEQTARGGGFEAECDSKKADSGKWKLGLIALAVIVVLGMALIWWRSL